MTTPTSQERKGLKALIREAIRAAREQRSERAQAAALVGAAKRRAAREAAAVPSHSDPAQRSEIFL